MNVRKTRGSITAPLEPFTLADLGRFEAGNHRVSCPSCGRGPRDKTLGLSVDMVGRAVWHCFRCNVTGHRWPDQIAPKLSMPMVSPRSKAGEKHDTLSEWGVRVWSSGRSISGVARAYLEARCCVIPPVDGDLRWHPALRHPTGNVGPALVARITDAVTGEALSLHRTWINPDGTKAEFDPPRLLLGGHRKQGGVIRLWPDEMISAGLGIAEGIESALCLAHEYKPVWAAIDAGNLRNLPVLVGIDSILIAEDADDTGRAAAAACGQRWADAGREARIVEVK